MSRWGLLGAYEHTNIFGLILSISIAMYAFYESKKYKNRENDNDNI